MEEMKNMFNENVMNYVPGPRNGGTAFESKANTN